MNKNINLFIVELVFNNNKFEITNNNNKNHLQLSTMTKLWYKENLINLAISKLFDKNWDNVAWIDSDIEFMDNQWVEKTINKLQNNDIVQLFSNCIQLDKNNKPTDYVNTGVIKYNYNNSNSTSGHPGYAWAMSRIGYTKIGKIPDLFIVGGADTRMSYGMLNIDVYLTRPNICFTEGFSNYIINVYNCFNKLKFDYVDCDIYHYYHGDIKNRKYVERHLLLSEFSYDPYNYIKYNDDGLIEVTSTFPNELIEKISNYFDERNEDE
jgi:hypothetical protein